MSLPDPVDGPTGNGSLLRQLVLMLVANPGLWPIPILAYMVYQQDKLLWSLVERLDRLSLAIDALGRAVR